MIHSARITSTGVCLIEDSSSRYCIPCLGSHSTEIPNWDIVNVMEPEDGIVDLTYLSRTKRPFQLKTVMLKILPEAKTDGDGSQEHLNPSDNYSSTGGTDHSTEQAHVGDLILSHVYKNIGFPKDRARTLVLVNPYSGPGHARELYDRNAAPVFEKAGLSTTVITTKSAGEALEIAKTVSLEEYGSIVCVSGDGLPHEVINGLAAREDAVEALSHFGLAQLPGGSGNAMCLSLNNSENDWAAVALGIVKGVPEPVDLMVLSQGDTTFYSFLSQSYGIVADCDLGTEDWRWMGGARFNVGIVWKCLTSNVYPCEIAYKEAENSTAVCGTNTTIKPTLRLQDPVPEDWHTEKHPKLSMFYVGKMQWMSYDAHVFPAAEPLDGAMDMIVWDTSFGPLKALNALTAFTNGQHMNIIPFYKKVTAYRITPLVQDNYVSIDGESYPCQPFQVEIVPGAARFITPM